MDNLYKSEINMRYQLRKFKRKEQNKKKRKLKNILLLVEQGEEK